MKTLSGHFVLTDPDASVLIILGFKDGKLHASVEDTRDGEQFAVTPVPPGRQRGMWSFRVRIPSTGAVRHYRFSVVNRIPCLSIVERGRWQCVLTGQKKDTGLYEISPSKDCYLKIRIAAHMGTGDISSLKMSNLGVPWRTPTVWACDGRSIHIRNDLMNDGVSFQTYTFPFPRTGAVTGVEELTVAMRRIKEAGRRKGNPLLNPVPAFTVIHQDAAG